MAFSINTTTSNITLNTTTPYLVVDDEGLKAFAVNVGPPGPVGPAGADGSDAEATTDAGDLVTGTLNVARLPNNIDAALIANGAVSNVEFQYLVGVTSGIQGQFTAASNALTAGLATKANTTHTHSAATDLTGVLPLANGGTGRANTVSTTVGIGAYTGTGTGNVVIGGSGTAAALTTAVGNTIVGSGAGALATASNNTLFGSNAGAALTNGTLNAFLGFSAGQSSATGTSNCSAVGYNALRYQSPSNNTAMGYAAGQGGVGASASGLCIFGYIAGAQLSSGSSHTIIGYAAGAQLSSQSNCTLVGWSAGSLNGGSDNVAVGSRALYQASSNGNVAIGTDSLFALTSGERNVGVGYAAAQQLSTGTFNTCIGNYAGKGASAASDYTSCTYVGYNAGLNTRTAGSRNCGFGEGAMYALTNGADNVSMGRWSGYWNSAGSLNVIIGSSAGLGFLGGSDYSSCTVVGYQAGLSLRTAANNNSFFGYRAGGNITTGANNVVIGAGVNAQSATESNQVNINNTFRRSGTAGAASKTSKAVSYGNGTTNTVIASVTNRRGRVQLFDSLDGWCTVRFTPTTLTIESGSSEYVTGAPGAGQIQVALSGSVLQIVLGASGAARSIGWSVDDIEFF